MNRRSVTTADQVTLTLLKYSLCETNGVLKGKTDWEKVNDIARKHMILPLVLQGVTMLPYSQRPSEQTLSAWKNYTIFTMLRNEQLVKAQAFAISILESAHIPCAILKGTSVSALYPKPELRALGDIDLLVHEELCENAVEILTANGYRKHESDHAFHIEFIKDGIHLELHYAISEFPNNPVGSYIKEILHDAIFRVKTSHIGACRVPVLSDADQALALLLHMERHMVEGGIGLRQLCDWSMFIKSIGEDSMNDEVLPAINDSKLMQFACAVTRICTTYLGLDSDKHHWCEQVSRKTADALLADILSSGNIARVERERFTSNVFTKSDECTDRNLSMISSAIKNLTASARKQYPISKKHSIILPVLWVYIPLRYWFRSMIGARPKQSIRKITKYARMRKRLFRSLALFKK